MARVPLARLGDREAAERFEDGADGWLATEQAGGSPNSGVGSVATLSTFQGGDAAAIVISRSWSCGGAVFPPSHRGSTWCHLNLTSTDCEHLRPAPQLGSANP